MRVYSRSPTEEGMSEGEHSLFTDARRPKASSMSMFSKRTARRPRSARSPAKNLGRKSLAIKWRRPFGRRHPYPPPTGQPGRCAANSSVW